MDNQVEEPTIPMKAFLKPSLRRNVLMVTVLGTVMLGACGLAYSGSLSEKSVRTKLAAAFPAAEFKSVSCRQGLNGLCEVITSTNRVFYSDKNGKQAYLGAVIDLATGADLVEARVKSLALLDGPAAAARQVAQAPAGQPSAQNAALGEPARPAEPQQPESPQSIKISLPVSNAVVMNPGGRIKLAAFTDLNCSFCARLHDAAKLNKDIELTEYPIEYLNASSGEKAKLVLCADDRVKALGAMHVGGQVSVTKDCSPAQALVAANTAFARQSGIVGTPTIIRPDGKVMSGFPSIEAVIQFAQGA